MPRRVDHDVRRREILEAVVRITVKGGLASATIPRGGRGGRGLRAPRAVLLRVQGELLLATQRHVAARSVARIRRLREGGSDEPREVLRTVMGSFVPVDPESRDAMLMFVALFTASLLDPVLKRREAHEVPGSMRQAFADQLRQARLRAGVDVDQEALRLMVMVTGLAQGVLDGQLTAGEAFAAIDYSLDRALRPPTTKRSSSSSI